MSSVQRVLQFATDVANNPAMQSQLERLGYRAAKYGLEKALADEGPTPDWLQRLLPVIRPVLTGALKAAAEKALPYALQVVIGSALLGGAIGYGIGKRK